LFFRLVDGHSERPVTVQNSLNAQPHLLGCPDWRAPRYTPHQLRHTIWQLQKGGALVLSAEESIAQYQRARNGPQGLGTFLVLIWAFFLPVSMLVWAIALKGRPPHTWRQT
jgi:hypothetical protein